MQARFRAAPHPDRALYDSTALPRPQRPIPGRGALPGAILKPAPAHTAGLIATSESTMEELRERLANLVGHVAGIMVRL